MKSALIDQYCDSPQIPSFPAGNDLGEEELYYFNARWYDSGLGRFITEDPIKDGLAWYAYANNNPLRYIDPTGLESADAAYEWFENTKQEGWVETQEFTSTELKESGAYQASEGTHTGSDYVRKNEAGENITEGSPVYPEEAGEIKYLRREDTGNGYGIFVGVSQPGGKITEITAHLKSIDPNLKVGSYVDKTTAVGEAGDTGFSEGAHVHREKLIDVQSDSLPSQLRDKGAHGAGSLVTSVYEGFTRISMSEETPWFMEED